MDCSKPCTTASRGSQITDCLRSTAIAELLHDQIRLNSQEQGLARESVACGSTSGQRLGLKQRRLTRRQMLLLQTTCGVGMQRAQAGRDSSGRSKAIAEKTQQDCDGTGAHDLKRSFAEMMTQFRRFSVYTDWTAIALLLFTAVPLLAVVATATVFVLKNKEKAPLS